MAGWITTVTVEGDTPRPLAVTGRSEPGGAAEVVEGIFVDLRTRDRQRREGSLIKRRGVTADREPALCQDFALELLQSVTRGEAASFTEYFIRGWLVHHDALAQKQANKAANRRRSGHFTKVQPN